MKLYYLFLVAALLLVTSLNASRSMRSCERRPQESSESASGSRERGRGRRNDGERGAGRGSSRGGRGRESGKIVLVGANRPGQED
uniref:Uncharacterized protein n=1 Tax=Caenorhabditis japonica TaxID=281687 RepID=A0A8R1INU1_CAEJA